MVVTGRMAGVPARLVGADRDRGASRGGDGGPWGPIPGPWGALLVPQALVQVVGVVPRGGRANTTPPVP